MKMVFGKTWKERFWIPLAVVITGWVITSLLSGKLVSAENVWNVVTGLLGWVAGSLGASLTLPVWSLLPFFVITAVAVVFVVMKLVEEVGGEQVAIGSLVQLGPVCFEVSEDEDNSFEADGPLCSECRTSLAESGWHYQCANVSCRAEFDLTEDPEDLEEQAIETVRGRWNELLRARKRPYLDNTKCFDGSSVKMQPAGAVTKGQA